MLKDKSVCVMGMGYVGLTLAVVLAEKGYSVCGVEINRDTVLKLNEGMPPFHEEGLTLRLKRQLARGALKVVASVPEDNFGCYIISVGTPLLSGQKVPNLDYIKNVVVDVAKRIKPGTLVCLRSTVPVGLTRGQVMPVLEEVSGLKAGKDFALAFTPERTIEGKALQELVENPQIIGGLTPNCAERAAAFYLRITPTLIRVGSLEAAELCKIVDNSYRDVRFAYANELAQVSERLGLDIAEVISACNTHYPRNNIPVPSPGVGGACLSKDPYILAYFASRAGYTPNLILEARRINEDITVQIIDRIASALKSAGKSIETARVAIAGFAFKGNPETSDLRDSTTLWLLRDLKNRGCRQIVGYDPVIDAEVLVGLGVEACEFIDDAVVNSDVLLIANNHRSYREWDVAALASKMARPSIIFDGWRMLDRGFVDSIEGLTYMGVGV